MKALLVIDVQEKYLSYYSADLEVIGVDGNSCVKKTCLDAVNAGYNVTLNLKCTAARNEKIFEKTLEELTDAGVRMIDT